MGWLEGGIQGGLGVEKGKSKDIKDIFSFSCVLTKTILNNARIQRAIIRPFTLIT